MASLETLAESYDRVKHIELSLAHGLPLREILRQVAALRSLLLPYKARDPDWITPSAWLDPI